MPTIHYIHGFNTTHAGEQTVGRLLKELTLRLPEWEHCSFSYGWVGLMGVWFLNPRIAQAFRLRLSEADIVLAHSNGCVIAYRAALLGAQIRHAILVAPPLQREFGRPTNIADVTVYHSSSDAVVRAAGWLRALAPWAPLGDPLWGDMGAVGSQGTSSSPYYPDKINRVVLSAGRVMVVPAVVSYWLLCGPLEVIFSLAFNRIVGTNKDMRLDVRRPADRRYILLAFVAPAIVMGIFAIRF